MNSIFKLIFLFLFLFLISCDNDEKLFRSVMSDESGINFNNKLTPTSDLNILTYLYYYNGAGVAIADFNNDQLQDIYFTSNQGQDKIYLNKGNLQFEDVTDRAGINNLTGWTTGITHVDINNDGLLDIYICKIGSYKTLEGTNLLYVNQGIGEDGIPVFKEQGMEYGLDISAFSTQSSFFDYDLDGDLDMFLLTHSVYPNRSYGRGENRLKVDSLAGDKLYENMDGFFVDVTAAAGIFQSKIGYGLGLAVGDVNKDGYPDIYVGNDFFENDYYYRNNGNKTFSELISSNPEIFGHTSHYSMGNSLADINNDGRLDIISLDMLPEDLITLKSSGVEEGFSNYNQYLKNGYSPQFMQNTLHLNKGEDIFSEVGFQSGIAATEWSWGVLAADFDMDGLKDLYITNGIVGATNDMDYINFISQNHIQYKIEGNPKSDHIDFIKYIPEKKVQNYAYQNNNNASFTNVTNKWFESFPSFSNGSAYADLDNDGDLDIVVNNVNEEAFILENLSNKNKKLNFLNIRLVGPEKNRNGIGAKIEVYANKLYLYEENFPVQSYLSAVPNNIIVGLGNNKKIDSVRVIWPDFTTETLYSLQSNVELILSHKNASRKEIVNPNYRTYLKNIPDIIDFKHHEESTLDFDRDPLIPFAYTNEGPAISVADINNDSLDDIFISGAKMQSSELFIQNKNGKFSSSQKGLFQQHALSEDVDQLFFDVDNDGDLDLLVVSGGNEFSKGDPLKPRLYINREGQFIYQTTAFEGVAINASAVRAIDIDNDGDIDILISSNTAPGKFGETAGNYIFQNDGSGVFKDITVSFSIDFKNSGLINDLLVVDLDSNGFKDIVAVGDWMPVTLFLNNGTSLTVSKISDSEGWWRSVVVEDFDLDGDLDIVCGNWGLNTRLTASSKEPIELYRNDFDDNGAVETIITYYYKGERTVLASRDELTTQMPFIKKKFLSYNEFAKASFEDIFSAKKINSAMKKEVKVLSTSYFENKGDLTFSRHTLPPAAQQSSVNDLYVDDFNDDGFKDLLMVGNNYEISTQLGRLDASHGVLLLNDRSGFFEEPINQSFNIAGPARKIKKIRINTEDYYIVSINNGKPIFLLKKKGYEKI